jgi:hypothetical protein
MLKYVLMFGGLFIMCVPEDVSLLRFALQGGFGLALFIRGVMLSLDEAAA